MNAALIQMLLQQRMQERSEQRRHEQAMQQSIVDAEMAQRQEIAKEKRKLARDVYMERFKAQLGAAGEGKEVALGGFDPSEQDMLLTTMSGARTEQALQGLTNAQRSGDVGARMTALQGFQAATGVGPDNAKWPAVNAEVVRRLGVQVPQEAVKLAEQASSEGVTAQTQLSKESEIETLKSITDSVVGRRNAARFGVGGGSSASVTDLLAEQMQQHPDIPPTRLYQAVVRGWNRADKDFYEKQMKQFTAEGATPEQIELRAAEKYLAARKRAVIDPFEALEPTEQAALAVRGWAPEDPVTGRRPVFLGNTSAANRFIDERIPVAQLMQNLDNVQTAWEMVERFSDPAKVGPILGTQGFQEALRTIGVQDPNAAAYLNLQFDLIGSFLKAKQGSRPSDFDFKMYLALMPYLTEVGSPAARARLQSLKQIMEVASQLPYDQQIQQKIAAFKKNRATGNDRVLDAATQTLRAAYENGDSAMISRAEADFQSAHRDWIAGGGAERWRLIREDGTFNMQGAAPAQGSPDSDLEGFNSSLGAP